MGILGFFIYLVRLNYFFNMETLLYQNVNNWLPWNFLFVFVY